MEVNIKSDTHKECRIKHKEHRDLLLEILQNLRNTLVYLVYMHILERERPMDSTNNKRNNIMFQDIVNP